MIYDHHRGYGLNVNKINSDLANKLVNDSIKIINSYNLKNDYPILARGIVDFPLKGNPAKVYSRIIFNPLEHNYHEDKEFILLLAQHEKGPFMQITSCNKNSNEFSDYLNLIKKLFNQEIKFNPHKFVKVDRFPNDHPGRYFLNEDLDDFTKKYPCSIANVDNSFFDSFNYENIKDKTRISEIMIGIGNNFENPWPRHKDIFTIANFAITTRNFEEIQKDKRENRLGILVSSGLYCNKETKKNINSLHKNIFEFFKPYRLEETVISYGRDRWGVHHSPSFFSPDTDFEKLAIRIVGDSPNFEVKGSLNDPIRIIQQMHMQLSQGDSTERKYADKLHKFL